MEIGFYKQRLYGSDVNTIMKQTVTMLRAMFGGIAARDAYMVVWTGAALREETEIQRLDNSPVQTGIQVSDCRQGWSGLFHIDMLSKRREHIAFGLGGTLLGVAQRFA